jgi:hypothetical protein
VLYLLEAAEGRNAHTASSIPSATNHQVADHRVGIGKQLACFPRIAREARTA